MNLDKTKIKKIIGITMYATPFAAIGFYFVQLAGLSSVLICLGIVALVTLWFGIAVTLWVD